MKLTKDELINELNDMFVYDIRILSLAIGILTDDNYFSIFVDWFNKYVEGIVKGTNSSS